MSLHWFNEYNFIDCGRCEMGACKGSYKLGVEKVVYNKQLNKNEQIGHRYITNGCFQKTANEYIDHVALYKNFKAFGNPYGSGWVSWPAKSLQIIQILDTESTYMRRKDG
jgi:hypothetical protein